MTERRACFICGSGSGPTVTTVDMDVCGLGRLAYGIRCCAGCGLVLQDPVVPPELMARHYEQFSVYTAFSPGDPPMPPTARRMLQIVAEAGLKPGRIYDSGAATGKMLFHFREAGWQVSGSDLSPVAVRQAKEFYAIDLMVGYCEDVLSHEHDLDLITLSHVLEHMYDPQPSLAAIHSALKDDGYFLLEVPFLASPERCAPGMFAMEHVNYFERTSLSNLLGQAGFAIVQTLIGDDNPLYPVITVLARKVSHTQDARASAFAENLAFCEAYTARDQALWHRAEVRFRAALAPRETAYIWSAGVQASMLLSRTSLKDYAHVAALTDRDPQKHGHTVDGLAIVPPAEVLASPHKIVIASYTFARDIETSLRESGVPEQRIVQIY
jgi:SAM-dependent methyltransferase